VGTGKAAVFHAHVPQTLSKIAKQMFDYIENYSDTGHRVIGIVMRDGSPTCGLHRTPFQQMINKIWGGMVWQVPNSVLDRPKASIVKNCRQKKAAKTEVMFLFLSLPEVPEAGDF